MDPADISQPLTIFLDWVRTLIPKDKYAIFVSLFQFPTPTTSLTGSIFNELERVFDGKNPSNNYEFKDAEYREDWENYRKNVLNEPEVWRKKGWDATRTAINSVLIVDLPAEQTGDYPEPYFYFLDISQVIDYEYHDDKIKWIIFKQPGNKIAVFDDETYRVFQLDDKNEITSEVIDRPHDLGFCPARFFWSTELVQKTPDIKKSPLSAQLANLDWLLFFATSKKHLDLYAPYPIYSAFEADCDFENNETGDYCDGGYLRDNASNYKMQRDGTVLGCPVCAEKRLAGVGSFIEIPVPEKDGPDLRNPINITTIDKGSLDYNVEEIARLSASIVANTVGLGGEMTLDKAFNKDQVRANSESKTNVLNSIKGNLDTAAIFYQAQ